MHLLREARLRAAWVLACGQGMFSRFFITGVVWLAALSIFLPTLANEAAPKSLTTSEVVRRIDTAEINRRAEALMTQLEMTGMSVAVVENGELTFAKGYGEVLRGSGEPVTEDTVFRWASVSKGVGANTLLSIIEDREIDLLSSAEALAPSLDLPPAETEVNLIHLLSHQIGIVRNAFDRRIEAGKPAKQMRAELEGLAYMCPPGTCHTYQNVAYDAASEIIEDVAGLPYKTVVQQRVFDPLGMSSASLTREGLMQSNSWARPHGRFGQRINRIKPHYYRVPAAAGVNSSVTDLAKWMVAQMPAPEEVLLDIPRARLTAMQTPIVRTPREQRFLNRRFHKLKDAHYGLGWRVYDYEGNKVIGHRGGVEGYRALVLFDPEKRSGIAMMWNSPHTRPIGLQMEFMDQLYGLPKRDWLRLTRKS